MKANLYRTWLNSYISTSLNLRERLSIGKYLYQIDKGWLGKKEILGAAVPGGLDMKEW
jgi:hypothetical protein